MIVQVPISNWVPLHYLERLGMQQKQQLPDLFCITAV